MHFEKRNNFILYDRYFIYCNVFDWKHIDKQQSMSVMNMMKVTEGPGNIFGFLPRDPTSIFTTQLAIKTE